MLIVRSYLSKMLRKKLKLDPLLSVSTKVNDETTFEENSDASIADQCLKLELNLNDSLKKISFPKLVEYVYCPLDYAFQPHSVFTHKYLKSPKKVLFLGMNPGPWGMCQSGVPFGEVSIVKDWFEINETVSKPKKECPERRVTGLLCSRSEISGQRFWGLMKNVCSTPENFFKSAFMYNYCPIAMLKNNGTNVTPTEVKGESQKQLEKLCDKALYDVIQLLQAEIVVGIGKYAEKRAHEILKRENLLNTKVLYLLHPSPRVANNQNWITTAEKKLDELGLMMYLKP